MKERGNSGVAFTSQFNQPLIHETSSSSWGLRRPRAGWWGASGSQDWALKQPQPPPEPLISEVKQTKVRAYLEISKATIKGELGFVLFVFLNLDYMFLYLDV